MIDNLQATGVSGLLATALDDVAKVPDPAHPGSGDARHRPGRRHGLTVHTGAGGDLAVRRRGATSRTCSPVSGALSRRRSGCTPSPRTRGWRRRRSGPVRSSSTATSRTGRWRCTATRDYWMTDADGRRLPYLDSITFRVIEDSARPRPSFEAGDIDLFATTNGLAITAAQGRHEDVSVTVQDTYVDSYYLLIDLSKPGTVAGSPRPLRDVTGDRPCRVQRRHQQRVRPAGQRPVLPVASRATSPTTG